MFLDGKIVTASARTHYLYTLSIFHLPFSRKPPLLAARSPVQQRTKSLTAALSVNIDLISPAHPDNSNDSGNHENRAPDPEDAADAHGPSWLRVGAW